MWAQTFVYFYLCPIQARYKNLSPHFIFAACFIYLSWSILKTFKHKKLPVDLMISIIDLTIKTPCKSYTVNTDFSACVIYRFTFYTFLTNTWYVKFKYVQYAHWYIHIYIKIYYNIHVIKCQLVDNFCWAKGLTWFSLNPPLSLNLNSMTPKDKTQNLPVSVIYIFFLSLG